MTTEAKIIAALAFVIAILGALWWYGEHRYNLGLAAGKAEVQTAWDKDRAAIQAVTDKAIADATKERDAALEANGVIQNEYQTQLSAARALNAALAQRLRNYQARPPTGGGSMPPSHGGPGPADAGASSSMGQIADILAAALTECAANRAQLDALLAELRPQL